MFFLKREKLNAAAELTRMGYTKAKSIGGILSDRGERER